MFFKIEKPEYPTPSLLLSTQKNNMGASLESKTTIK